MGIEPTQPAWKAGILPLNYARKYNTRTPNRPNGLPQNAQPSLPERSRLIRRLGETGFEPVKANATRFTVWPLWPLRYSPLAYFNPACIPLNKSCKNTRLLREKPDRLLAEASGGT